MEHGKTLPRIFLLAQGRHLLLACRYIVDPLQIRRQHIEPVGGVNEAADRDEKAGAHQEERCQLAERHLAAEHLNRPKIKNDGGAHRLCQSRKRGDRCAKLGKPLPDVEFAGQITCPSREERRFHTGGPNRVEPSQSHGACAEQPALLLPEPMIFVQAQPDKHVQRGRIRYRHREHTDCQPRICEHHPYEQSSADRQFDEDACQLRRTFVGNVVDEVDSRSDIAGQALREVLPWQSQQSRDEPGRLLHRHTQTQPVQDVLLQPGKSKDGERRKCHRANDVERIPDRTGLGIVDE